MLKTFKNRFFEIITENGFDPNNFITEETMINGNPAFIIKYKNTMFRFIAMNLKNEFGNFGHQFSRFTEGYQLSDFPNKNSWYDIDDDETFKTFNYWLEEHLLPFIDEIEATDLWNQVQREKDIISDLSDIAEDNTLFTIKEKNIVLEALNSFKENALKELQLSDDQTSILEDKIDYLAGAVDRLTKLDWKNVAISTIISISVALSLDVERGRGLFNLFKEAFKFSLKLISN